jgi:hypothetical protein
MFSAFFGRTLTGFEEFDLLLNLEGKGDIVPG